MKTRMIMAALALLLTGAAQALTQQECEKAWSKEPWVQGKEVLPDFTCVPLTNQLLVILEGATKARVIDAMKADGRWLDHDTRLNFKSIPSGVVNFTFENDKAVYIFGWTNDGGDFNWNQAQSSACSDLPGSHYARCNKER